MILKYGEVSQIEGEEAASAVVGTQDSWTQLMLTERIDEDGGLGGDRT